MQTSVTVIVECRARKLANIFFLQNFAGLSRMFSTLHETAASTDPFALRFWKVLQVDYAKRIRFFDSFLGTAIG